MKFPTLPPSFLFTLSYSKKEIFLQCWLEIFYSLLNTQNVCVHSLSMAKASRKFLLLHSLGFKFIAQKALILPYSLYCYCSLIHAYAVARDMEEALSCVRRMKDEGIEMSLVTHSILVDGFAKLGNIE